jgi:hypothetical protein
MERRRTDGCVGVGRGRLKVGCPGEGGFKSRTDVAQLDEALEGEKRQERKAQFE